MRRLRPTLVPLALVCLAAPAGAHAATVRAESAPEIGPGVSRLVVTAAPGEANRVLIGRERDGGGIAIIDYAVPLTAAGSGCQARDAHTVVCEPAAVFDLAVELGDRDDELGVVRDVGVRVDGGDGDDRITGGTRGDEIFGGRGNDRLDGGHGSDTIEDGAGDDVVAGGSGPDLLTLGTGRDRVDAGEGSDHVLLDDGRRQRGDRIACGTGVDGVLLPRSPDRLAADCERVAVRGGALVSATPVVRGGVARFNVRCPKRRACRGAISVGRATRRYALPRDGRTVLRLRLAARSARTGLRVRAGGASWRTA